MPQLYFVFWMFSLYDLEVPVDAYASLVSRLRSAADQGTMSSSQRAKEKERIDAIQKKVPSFS